MDPIVSFALLLLAHLASRLLALWLRMKRKLSPAEQQLASDIKDLLRQANSLSTPSTFAKAAKLKRIAVAKERELVQLRKNHGKEQDWPFLWEVIKPNALQISMYFILAYWHWGYPVLAVPSRSIYPFDGTISWKPFTFESKTATEIGILPWLVVCSRVCVFLAKKAIP